MKTFQDPYPLGYTLATVKGTINLMQGGKFSEYKCILNMQTTQVIASLYGSAATKCIFQAIVVSRGTRGFHVFLLNMPKEERVYMPLRKANRCGWYRPLARSLLQRLWICGERSIALSSTAIEDWEQQI